ncbi:MAG: tetratricopeptide repeat protein [Nitrososphaera sp.]
MRRQSNTYFRQAAERGHAGAQYNLAMMYDTGRGIARDYAEAFKWYRKAARQGHAGAQEALRSIAPAAGPAFVVSRSLPAQIAEPFVLAMLDLHIELRRALGTSNHTRVPALVKDSGCAGDFISNRVIHAYGQAIAASAVARTDSSDLFAPVLGEVAQES